MTGSDLRIVTINTAKGDFDYSRRLDLLGRRLKLLDPDVVLLQEALATDDGSRDTTVNLPDMLGLPSSYAPARHKTRLVDGEWLPCHSGLGVLRRLPIQETDRLALPCDGNDGERIAQLLSLDWDTLPVLLVNIHLSHLRGRDDLRREQFRTLLSHQWFDNDWSAKIIGGDFNTPPERLHELLPTRPNCDWQDCYINGSGQEPRATVPVDRGAVEGRRVDYIMSITVGGGHHPTVRGAAVVFSEPENGIYSSDHRGVMVELALPGACNAQ